MRKFLLLLVLTLLTSCSKINKNPPNSDQNRPDNINASPLIDNLSKLEGERRYFEMRDVLKSAPIDNNTELLFYRAYVKCLFEETDSSIILFDKFLSIVENPANKNLTMLAYQLQGFNYFKNRNPRKSSEVLREYYSKYREQINNNDRNKLVNNINIRTFEAWAQTSFSQKSSAFEMKLINRDPTRIAVSLVLNGKEAEFILDTGSEVNSIPQKYVKEFGIREFSDVLYSEMVTGNHKVHPGIADSLIIGNLVVKNAPFFVYADNALPLGNPKFIGTIGYPLMRHLGKILINFKDMKILSATKQLSPANQNMCNSGLGVIINAETNINSLYLFFDTGTYKTVLQNTIKTNENHFQYTQVPDTVVDLNQNKFISKKWIAPIINFNVSDKKFELNNVPVTSKQYSSNTGYMDGVIGVEALKQYNYVYIDFKNLIIEFE
ncbi:MAG: retropepsin-like aspartic protease [Ignavibacteria bacterium]